MSLTFRQRCFVNEYLVELNAAKAAIRAGYSQKTAKSQGSRLLTNVDVRSEIQRRQLLDEVELKIDREKILKDLEAAIKIAKKKGDAHTMILAAAEINKMMGYYA
jgi:phage terminase small subunit